ncbi:MAG: HAD-IC family P-type ATPase, partial [Pseudomonadota bacterium]
EPEAAVREHAGRGVDATFGGVEARLGSAAHCGAEGAAAADGSSVWLRLGDGAVRHFALADAPRPGADAAISALREAGLSLEVLSGDAPGPVRAAAEPLGLKWRAQQSPQDKIAAVEAADGPTLMVGDGLNDAPALAAADVSMAPAGASDVGRAAADMVFTGRSLAAVATAYRVARQTRAVILQNFAVAGTYNLIAIPLAIAGYCGPLEAAIAMSSSSLLVTLNALRIGRGGGESAEEGGEERRVRAAASAAAPARASLKEVSP